ncbi:hypothetical protein BTR23_18800 [Alkalihalophilus pseudofirmus]|nr:hypothetical protein BTR23_18800 [Alkalihalophilus pseudofirmus]
MKKTILLLVIALVGGGLGYLTNFPIGALLGTLILIVVFNLKFELFTPLPIRKKRLIQMLIGGSIGLTFSGETFAVLSTLWLPALIIASLTIVFSFLLSILLCKILKFDFISALCSLAPAGMSEMLLIAEKHGAYIPAVVTMHLFRIITIITIIPIIVYLVI